MFQIRKCLKFAVSLMISLIILNVSFGFVHAQQNDYRLNISRTFGYGNGSQIRGTFTLRIDGPGNMRSVKYIIDDQLIAEVTADPFTYSFQTTQYASGWHDLSAVIETNDGQKFTAPARRFDFVTAEEESSSMVGIIVPLLGGIVLVLVIVVLFQTIAFRKKPLSNLAPGTPRDFGMRGGTICPHCHRPYGLHWWAVSIGFRNRVDRCEFCGKWSIVRPLGKSELDAAVSAEVVQAQTGQQIPAKTEQDRLKEMIDNSRFTDQ